MTALFQMQPCSITDDRIVSNAALVTEYFKMQLCCVTDDRKVSNAALQVWENTEDSFIKNNNNNNKNFF